MCRPDSEKGDKPVKGAEAAEDKSETQTSKAPAAQEDEDELDMMSLST